MANRKYTYATVKDNKICVESKGKFKHAYMSLLGGKNVKIEVKITFEDYQIGTGKNFVLYGTLDMGGLKYDIEELNKILGQIEGETIRIDVSKNTTKRNGGLLGYYKAVVLIEFVWGYIDILGESISLDMADDFLRYKFLPQYTHDEEGKEIIVPGETEDLTRDEYEMFLEHCRGFIKEFFNRQVPLPETKNDQQIF